MFIKNFTLLGLTQILPLVLPQILPLAFSLESPHKFLFPPHKILSPSYHSIKLVINVKKKIFLLFLPAVCILQELTSHDHESVRQAK